MSRIEDNLYSVTDLYRFVWNSIALFRLSAVCLDRYTANLNKLCACYVVLCSWCAFNLLLKLHESQGVGRAINSIFESPAGRSFIPLSRIYTP